MQLNILQRCKRNTYTYDICNEEMYPKPDKHLWKTKCNLGDCCRLEVDASKGGSDCEDTLRGYDTLEVAFGEEKRGVRVEPQIPRL